MKKFLGVLLIFCSVFSFNKVYAMITEYEAKSFTITVQNIDEKIEKIDVVAFEECEMEETGFNYETTYIRKKIINLQLTIFVIQSFYFF